MRSTTAISLLLLAAAVLVDAVPAALDASLADASLANAAPPTTDTVSCYLVRSQGHFSVLLDSSRGFSVGFSVEFLRKLSQRGGITLPGCDTASGFTTWVLDAKTKAWTVHKGFNCYTGSSFSCIFWSFSIGRNVDFP